MKFEIDIKMTLSALYDYNMYCAYTGASGILGTAVGACFLVLYAGYGYFYYLAAGILLIAYTPVTLFTRSHNQVKLNPVYKEAFHYVMDDTGVTVSVGEDSLTVEWDVMTKAASTNQSILLYTAPKSAWVFPKKDLGERRYELIEMISTHMPASKVKIKQ